MSVQYIMPNGEIVPVPQEIVADSLVAQQGFYDGQLARLVSEGAVEPVEPAGSNS